MSRWSTLSVLATTALVSAFSAGCSGSAAGDSSPALTTAPASAVTTPGAAAATTTRAPLVTPAHGRAHRVAEALGQVALRDDQRAQLETLAASLEAQRAGAITAQRDLAETMATQIADATRTTLDRAALEPKVTALVAAWGAVQPKERAAFESVHAILDAGQRAELVAALEAHGHGEHMDHEEHGWNKGKGHGPGQRWADELELNDLQRVAFFQILHEGFTEGHAGMGEMEHAFHKAGHGRALLEAFKADTFSFDAVAPAEDIGARASGKAAHFFDMVEKVLPILTPEQRTLAAQKIRDHVEQLPLAP
jgi:hypothetical protein